MKTFDAIELVNKHLAQKIKNYPSESLSSREVIFTLPVNGNPEKLAQTINAKITLDIYHKAEEFAKNVKPSNKWNIVSSDDSKKRSEELTKFIVKNLSDLC